MITWSVGNALLEKIIQVFSETSRLKYNYTGLDIHYSNRRHTHEIIPGLEISAATDKTRWNFAKKQQQQQKKKSRELSCREGH